MRRRDELKFAVRLFYRRCTIISFSKTGNTGPKPSSDPPLRHHAAEDISTTAVHRENVGPCRLVTALY